MYWKPLDSAPLDGDVVLFKTDARYYDPFVGSCREVTSNKRTKLMFQVGQDHLSTTDDVYIHHDIKGNVTHWAPLPTFEPEE